MFIGHYAAGLGAKRFVPAVSLGTLFLAAQLPDLLWPAFLLLGLERVLVDPASGTFPPLIFVEYPFSHSLLAALVWSAVAGLAYYAVRRSRRSAAVIAALVLTHWCLDALVHHPDLPLVPGGSMRIGLGLWNSVPVSGGLELLLFAAGVVLAVQATRPRDRTGTYSFAVLILLLLLLWAGNLAGPPPPGETAVAVSGLAQWVFVVWGYWTDRHRTTAG